jgi:hypothetical protein
MRTGINQFFCHMRGEFMRTILILAALLWLDAHQTMAAEPLNEAAKKFAAGYDFLKKQKYQEARTAYEGGLQQSPANAMAHFYLGDACRGLKAWACAEEHYETSLELDAKSSVADLAKQRGRKAKIWRLLDEEKQAINAPNVSPDMLAQAEDTLVSMTNNRPAIGSCERKLSRGTNRVTGCRWRLIFQTGRWYWCRRGSSRWGVWGEIQTSNRCVKFMSVPFSWISTKSRCRNMRGSWNPHTMTARRNGLS